MGSLEPEAIGARAINRPYDSGTDLAAVRIGSSVSFDAEREALAQARLADQNSARAVSKPEALQTMSDRELTSRAELLHRGIDTVFEDQALVHAALRNLSPADIKRLEQIYLELYNGDMRTALDQNGLGDDPYVQAQLASQHSLAAAYELKERLPGIFTGSPAAALEYLSSIPKEQRAEVLAHFERNEGKSFVEAYRRYADPDERYQIRAAHLAEGSDGVAALHALYQHAYPDAGAPGTPAVPVTRDSALSIVARLDAKDREILKWILDASPDFKRELSAKLGKDGMLTLESTLNNDPLGITTARTAQLLNAGTYESSKELLHIFESLSTTERNLLARRFEAEFGEPLVKRIMHSYGSNFDEGMSMFSGPRRLAESKPTIATECLTTALQDGHVPPSMKVRFAVVGGGTDTQLILTALGKLNADEVNQVEADYLRRYDENMRDRLSSELSGRDWFKAQQALRGRPESLTDLIGRMQESYDFEKRPAFSGAGIQAVEQGVARVVAISLGTSPAAAEELLKPFSLSQAGRNIAFVRDALTGDDERVEQHLSALKNEAAGNRSSGVSIPQRVRYTAIAQDEFIETKDFIADQGANAAAVAGAAIATVATHGAAAPILVGALSYSGSKAAIQGSVYDAEGLAVDLTSGAVGAIPVKVPGAAKLTQRLSQFGAAGKVSGATVDHAASGAIGGGLSGGTAVALDGETWEAGVSEGVSRTLTGAGQGALTGAATGVIVGPAIDGISTVVGKRSRDQDSIASTVEHARASRTQQSEISPSVTGAQRHSRQEPTARPESETPPTVQHASSTIPTLSSLEGDSPNGSRPAVQTLTRSGTPSLIPISALEPGRRLGTGGGSVAFECAQDPSLVLRRAKTSAEGGKTGESVDPEVVARRAAEYEIMREVAQRMPEGVPAARLLGRFERDGTEWQVYERAHGTPLHTTKPTVEEWRQQLELLSEAPQSHYDAFVADARALAAAGIKIDPSKPNNFLYHPEHGFSFIDLSLNPRDPTGMPNALPTPVLYTNMWFNSEISQSLSDDIRRSGRRILEKFERAGLDVRGEGARRTTREVWELVRE